MWHNPLLAVGGDELRRDVERHIGDYAYKNEAEFMAVVSEHFFETPFQTSRVQARSKSLPTPKIIPPGECVLRCWRPRKASYASHGTMLASLSRGLGTTKARA
ncbi:Glucose-regulated metallo-peptidase M90 [Neorhodopirellula lusitana]|uniref:Glucose-regulated metallo-peptidase M90 n=1 Tax=Neorhodopirellula lusitana TaxID=445327 RepID=A0ABY1Q152_9BACT|nr:Glucose-regulated metallo-peptidase M90 [Neorhodopirellula lusitana]